MNTHTDDCECYFCFYKIDPINGNPITTVESPVFCHCGPTGHNPDCEIGYRKYLLTMESDHDIISHMIDDFRKLKGSPEEYF